MAEARPRACRSVQNSWNQARCPTSQSIGLTMARRGPIHRASSRSETSASVRDRASRRSDASGSIVRVRIICRAVRVALICPVPPGSRLGNRVTALRWQRMLRQLGHQAFIATGGTSRRCDLLIALHAGRSAEAVRLSSEEHPRRPLVVALTGTDLYNDIHRDPRARGSLELAGWLIVLHDEAARALPASQRRKARVVPQSAPAVRRKPKPDRRAFEVAVVAH